MLPGHTLPLRDEDNVEISAEGGGVDCYDEMMEEGGSGSSAMMQADSDDSDAGDDASTRFSPRKTRSMIQMRLTSTGN